ncbi:dihydrofolate reductase family protein [Nocardia sp. NPDC005978]|uniref:dihydrofolate reductase family protein n=1 Tax=Nocardia sp. NPDC005978 TaxID=3156725 RepID=UPI0033B182A2
MGTITLWMQTSLDGYSEGYDDVYWPIVDEELCAPFVSQLTDADMFLYGRKTYEIMASFWPTADRDPGISPFYTDFARCWKRTPKLVFSRTLHSPGWDTRVVTHDLIDEVAALKATPNRKMMLFGGATTIAPFIEHGLIDEYRLFVHPVLLGRGRKLFPSGFDSSALQLMDVTTFDSAVVQMHYKTHRKEASPFTGLDRRENHRRANQCSTLPLPRPTPPDHTADWSAVI